MHMQSLPGSLHFPQESLGTRLVECITYPPLESTRQPQQLMSLTTDYEWDPYGLVKYHLHKLQNWAVPVNKDTPLWRSVYNFVALNTSLLNLTPSVH